MSEQSPPQPFTTLAAAQAYVREQLQLGLPEGWAAQWQGSAEQPLPVIGSWLIRRFDAELRTWQGSDEYSLLLTADLATFVLTHSNGLPGPGRREAIGTTADLVPVRNLVLASLGEFLRYAFSRHGPNVYDLT